MMSTSTNTNTGSALEEFRLMRTPTPLAALLHLYKGANHECYINYMEGAKRLAAWLAPIEVTLATRTIPTMLRTYELNALAKVLLPYTSNTSNTVYQLEDAIYVQLIK
jgi:hypothetical protein